MASPAIEALEKVLDALDALPQEDRERVLVFAWGHYRYPGQQPPPKPDEAQVAVDVPLHHPEG